MKTENLKLTKGWWLPIWDTHFEKMLKEIDNKYEYQYEQRKYALSWVKDFNCNSIDVGSNIGFWSKQLAEKFKHVYAFEPHPDNNECYKKNLNEYNNYTLYEIAVSNVSNKILELYVSPDECGNASLNNFGVMEGTTNRKIEAVSLKTIPVKVDKIDDYNLKDIGFIKVDCQNHEKEVVEGAIQTIDKYSPVLCLELPTRNQKEIDYRNNMIEYLKKYNYIYRGSKNKETIFTR
jgi:FkbM family methyltransferase